MKNPAEVKKPDIAERSISYSLRIIQLYRELEEDSAGRVLGQQVLRSGTSIGANIHEAQGAQSRADFIARMTIAYKEVLETLYWLRLIEASEVVKGEKLGDLFDETQQLIKILSSILLSSKKGIAQDGD